MHYLVTDKPISYQEFLAIKLSLEAKMEQATAILHIYPRSTLGITPDDAKDENWHSAKQLYNNAKFDLNRLYKNEKVWYQKMLAATRKERDAKREMLKNIRSQ